MESTTRYGLHVVLTNNPPRLTDDSTTPLARRILPVIMKTTLMREKGRELGMATDVEIKQFVRDNAQAFANVFVHTYLSNPMRYAAVNYNTDAFYDVQRESKDERQKYQTDTKADMTKVKSEQGIFAVLQLARERLGLRTDGIEDALRNPDGVNIREEDDAYYINRSRNYLGTIVDDVLAFQTLFKDVYKDDVVKKGGLRMFRILKPKTEE